MSEQKRVEAQRTIEQLVTSAKEKVEPIKYKLMTTETWIRHFPLSVTRNEEGSITGYETATEAEERPSWRRLSTWLREEFAKTPEFQDALGKLSQAYGMKSEQLVDPLTSFLAHMIMEKDRNGNMAILLNDLEGKPCEWKVTAQLVGVHTETSIVIAEGVILRRVEDSDLSFEELAGLTAAREDLMRFPESILDITIMEPYPIAVQRKVERLCILLSLFKESSAYYESYTGRAKSFSRFGLGTSRRIVRPSTTPRAIIDASESTDLAKFIQFFEPRIPAAIPYGRIVDPLEIAMKRYLESVRESKVIEERLTTAVMGLEALFLEQENELRFRLALRTAQILKHLGENAQEVYDTVSKAYGYRSSHVHGSILSEEDAMGIQEVTNRIWRYLRKSLLFWVAEGVASESKKKQLLKDIDSSLVDDNKRENLKGRIEAAKLTMKGAV